MNEKQKKQKGKKAKLYSRPDKEPAFYLLWVAELRGLKLSFGKKEKQTRLKNNILCRIMCNPFQILGTVCLIWASMLCP